MTTTIRLISIAATIAVLCACTTTPSTSEVSNGNTASVPAVSLKSRMVGSWNGEINGMPMDLEYTESAIKIPSYGMELPYQLDGDVLTVEVMGQQQKSKVSFRSDDEMVQTNVDSGSTLTLTRKK